MSPIIEVKIPDIGDFHDVPVIEILVKAGDNVQAEDPLLTLESDKATLDVPAPVAGIIKRVLVKLGDKVSEGTLIAELQAIQSEAIHQPVTVAMPASPAEPAPPIVPAPSAVAGTANADLDCDLLVLGAGPGGYSAAFRAADLGLNVALVERYPTLGGVCLNVGCIPSKALLHIAAMIDEARALDEHGVHFSKAKIDLDRLRAWKEKVVAKLTGGLAGMAKGRKINVIQGIGHFIDPQHLRVEHEDRRTTLRFARAIIAAGSAAIELPALSHLKDDPRLIDSTGALMLARVPQTLLVIGGGIIGLEMATVYQALGAKITVVELASGLMPGADRDLVKVWEKRTAPRFERILLNTAVTAAQATANGIEVTLTDKNGQQEKAVFDLVLSAVGRTPNGKKIAAENAGVEVDARGFIHVDRQMRTNVRHILAIGDITGQPMLAHKAVHEGHVAAEVAAGELRNDEKLQRAHFDALQIPSVAYTNPEIAYAGKTEEQLKAEAIRYEKALFPWAASGRAIANGRDEGFTKLLFDSESKRLIGGGIVGPHAGDLIGEICLAIEMGADATDIGKTIHPHPTLCETIGMAAEAGEGRCTDLPPSRKRETT